MNKLLSAFLLLCLICCNVEAYDFYVKDKNGVNIYYTILSSSLSNRTAEVTVSPEGYPRDVAIPETVTSSGKKYKVISIANNAFENQKLTSVTIPESVTSIGSKAFYNCIKLESIVFPNSVENMGEDVFGNLYSLKQPIYNDKIFAYYPLISGYDYEVQNGTAEIASGAFANALNLRKIVLPESLTRIGDNNIADNRAFIETLVVKASTPPECTENAFGSGFYETIEVYVSDSDPAIIESYKNHPVWSKFQKLQAANLSDDEGPAADVNKDGAVNASDIVTIYNYIIMGDTSGVTETDADVNSDGVVNAADVVAVYNYIIEGNN